MRASAVDPERAAVDQPHLDQSSVPAPSIGTLCTGGGGVSRQIGNDRDRRDRCRACLADGDTRDEAGTHMLAPEVDQSTRQIEAVGSHCDRAAWPEHRIEDGDPLLSAPRSPAANRADNLRQCGYRP